MEVVITIPRLHRVNDDMYVDFMSPEVRHVNILVTSNINRSEVINNVD